VLDHQLVHRRLFSNSLGPFRNTYFMRQTKATRGIQGAAGGTDRASQSRQQRKVDNKRMLDGSLSFRSKEVFSQGDELYCKTNHGSKDKNKGGLPQLSEQTFPLSWFFLT
jgi:hypothetical protein